MIQWHRIGRLILDRDGDVWLWCDPGFRYLGPLAAADVPLEMEDDRAELLDLWQDAAAAADPSPLRRNGSGRVVASNPVSSVSTSRKR